MYQNYSVAYGDVFNRWIWFGGVSATPGNNVHVWSKPTNAHFVEIICVGGGAGGGGGGASAAATSGAGGEGGGSGGSVRAIFDANTLPTVLYVMPGDGGTGGTGQVQGGAAATAGTNAARSFVCQIPDTSSVVNIYCVSGAVAATGGQAASGATAGTTAGLGETVGGAPNAGMLVFGVFTAQSGSSGTNGGTTGAGVSNNNFLSGAAVYGCGGCGGAGVNAGTTTAIGGAITATGWVPGIAGGAAGGGAGSAGHDWIRSRGLSHFPMTGTGGTGGGSNTSALTGGKGGPGAPSSGGGGGGGTNGTASVAGAGGDGGPGFVIITCW